MEHISDILKKRTRTSSSAENTDTSSSAEPAPEVQVCPVCRGARFVHPLLPTGKPDYGRIVPCRCARQDSESKRTTRLQQYSNLGSLTRATFAAIPAEGWSKDAVAREQFREAYRAAQGFAAQPEGWLVITGPSGCGKTQLAAAIANRCIEKETLAFYVTAADLLDHLRASFSPASDMAFDEFFDQVRDAPVLVLDDFGSQSATPWAKEKLDQLLSHRHAARLPTVVVCTVPVEELEDRARTRLLDTGLCRIYSLGSPTTTLHLRDWAPGFELQRQMTFESFNHRDNLPAEQRQNLEMAFNLARSFAESPDGWLVFAGVNGCGKTHLAAAIVNYRYKQGKPALFIVVPDFLDHLRSTFSPDSKVSYDRFFESVRNVELLVLDDFGEQASTPWAQEKLYQVINHRYNARRATVMTTTCSLEEMDNRVASRLGDHKISTLFNITVPDYRVDRPAQKRPAYRLPRRNM